MDETGVLSGFVANLRRAMRCWRADPRLPVAALTIAAVHVAALAVGLAADSVVGGMVSLLVTLATLGFLGATRVWYLEIDADRRIPAADVVALSRTLWKRFFGLGVYITVLMIVPFAIGAAIGTANRVAGLVLIFVTALALDALLTFATVALSFWDMTAGSAVRYSWAVTKAQWPQCALYVLAAPFAARLVFLFARPADISVALYVVVALAIAGFELLCKGATVLFYSDRYFASADEPALPSPPPIT